MTYAMAPGFGRRLSVLCALVMAVVAFCYCAESPAAPKPAPIGFGDDSFVEEMYGGEKQLTIVRNPDRVVVWRLEGREAQGNPIELNSDPTTGAEVPVPAGVAQRLAATMAFPKSYLRSQNLCVPEPIVRISFLRESERVDVLPCFNCQIAMVFHQERRIGFSSLTRDAVDQMTIALKEVLTDGAAIQDRK